MSTRNIKDYEEVKKFLDDINLHNRLCATYNKMCAYIEEKQFDELEKFVKTKRKFKLFKEEYSFEDIMKLLNESILYIESRYKLQLYNNEKIQGINPLNYIDITKYDMVYHVIEHGQSFEVKQETFDLRDKFKKAKK